VEERGASSCAPVMIQGGRESNDTGGGHPSRARQPVIQVGGSDTVGDPGRQEWVGCGGLLRSTVGARPREV